MAHKIIRQPNGLYALWSTVSDGFLQLNCTAEEVLDLEDVEALERQAKRIRDTLDTYERGELPEGAMTFEHALDIVRHLHSDAEADKAARHVALSAYEVSDGE